MENEFAVYKKYATLLECVCADFSDNLIEIGKKVMNYKVFVSSHYKNLRIVGYVNDIEVIVAICEINQEYNTDDLHLNKLPFDHAKEIIGFIGSFKKIMEKAKKAGRKLIIVGYGLGGTISQITAKAMPKFFDECYCFNSQSGKNMHYSTIKHDKDGFYILELDGSKTYTQEKIYEDLYNYQNKAMTTKVVDIISKNSAETKDWLLQRERFGKEVFISNKSDTISEMVRALEFYDNVADVAMKDSFNLISMLGAKTGGNIKVFSGSTSIADMMKILEFYEFCLNNGVSQDEISNYLIKINEMTNRPIAQMAFQTLINLKDEQKFQENQNRIFDLNNQFKIDLNKYLELQAQKFQKINLKNRNL